jgi:hypothetical protein
MHREFIDRALQQFVAQACKQTVSGVSRSMVDSGPSSSSTSRGTVIVTFSPLREVKNVLRKMRYIHARKLVPNSPGCK